MHLHRRFCLVAALALCAQLSAQEISLPSLSANNTSAVQGSENGNARPAAVSKLPIRSLLYPGATTKVFVRLMLWWGDSKHVNMGYRSDDKRQIQSQVADMQSRGIDGAIVDWYGPGDTPRNRAMTSLLRTAEQSGFLVAASVDKGALQDCVKHGCDETAQLASLINYVVQNYASSSAYWRWRGRPVVTFFGLEKHDIDWGRVRNSLQGQPLLIFRNSGGFSAPESDGAFAWIAPETVKPSDPIAEEYLERFYKKAKDSGGKLTIGAVYKGFDDSMASWGKGKRLDQRCGKTWLDTFAIINQNYSSNHPLDALIIPTWNDYEEGTSIEPGIASCVQLRVDARGSKLRWDVDGPSETIDHFEVYAVEGRQQARLLAQLPVRTHEFDTRGAAGTFVVEAVGRPSIQNVSAQVTVNGRDRD
jgi:Glycosyl hydrolase family 71